MARRARCGWVRSVLTQEVVAIAAARPRIDAARPKLTSGQLPFLGSSVVAGASPHQRAALPARMPQRASAASSATRASNQCAPSGVGSFFQNGAWVLR